MFTSSLEAIGAWRAQRLPLARFGLLALLLAWAAGADTMTAARALASIALALSLVAQCRLWDDLIDRERDRRAHPERLLAAAEAPGAFVTAVAVLALANAIALGLLWDWPRALGAALLFALLALWYRRHRARGLLHAHVLLLKYPAFVLLLAASPFAARTLAAPFVVYAAMCAFEILDAHSASSGARAARYVPFACAAVALVMIYAGVEP
jgi:4-hydroxybenzoate polyprenyltransferase